MSGPKDEGPQGSRGLVSGRGAFFFFYSSLHPHLPEAGKLLTISY